MGTTTVLIDGPGHQFFACAALTQNQDGHILSRHAATTGERPLGVQTVFSGYGCNMAFRMSAINDMHFDERLVLYGWLEDKEFSRKAAKNGRLVECSLLAGVHLGLQSGRVSGKRYGYSQVVNAWYLHKKGILSSSEAWSNIGKALLVNGAKSFRAEKHIDRLGRLGGNLIGVRDVVLGRGLPERAAEL